MDRRTKFRQGLSNIYLPYYDALCGVLGPEWQPYSGYRTFEEQGALYQKGRVTAGAIVTRAKGGMSPHNYGCATDWCMWDKQKPYWPDSDSKLWLPYINAIAKVGLRDGHMFGDTPHNELIVETTWRSVYLVYTKQGMTAAQQKIEAAHTLKK